MYLVGVIYRIATLRGHSLFLAYIYNYYVDDKFIVCLNEADKDLILDINAVINNTNRYPSWWNKYTMKTNNKEHCALYLDKTCILTFQKGITLTKNIFQNNLDANEF